MLHVFLEEKEVEECKSVRQVMSSGEALGIELEQRFFERIPWARSNNLYGPTEAAVDVSYWHRSRHGPQCAYWATDSEHACTCSTGGWNR